MIGQTISHYKITAKLGAGGMGEVYLATDTKLDRRVALKFLPESLQQDPEARERLLREAKSVSKLNHSNILTVFTVEEVEGRDFIVMEYVEGKPLPDWVRDSGPSLKETVDLAVQVGEGLSAAHERGIIHRDIKPENIMVTSKGHVKITDFGLALLQGATTLTKSGTRLGTVYYMSPEQAEGRRVDHRSDVFSLGIVMYELLCRQRPFEGESEAVVLYEILSAKPQPLARYCRDIPDDLERIIAKCLAKSSDERYQSAADLTADLRRLRRHLDSRQPQDSQQAAQAQRSIAVLPFVDLSPDKAQEYFCDGIAEEIITALTHVAGLHVVARTSAFAFKGQPVGIREIGGELNVDTILEGSVRKAGERVRITAQLVNVANGYHLWSEKYDRDLKDIFAIQDEIGLAVANKLKAELLNEEEKAILRHRTLDLEAHNHYLKGIYFLRRYTADGFREAIEHFQRALDKDPNYALAYYGLAEVFYVTTYWGNTAPNEAYPRAKTYVKKALGIDHQLGEAHAALGLVYAHYDWNWELAESELHHALRLNPSSAMVHMVHSWLLSITQRHEDAIIEATRAQELDPLSNIINTHVGFAYIWASQYDQAIEQLRTVLSMSPGFYLAHYYLGLAYRANSMIEEAVTEFEKAVELGPETAWPAMILAATYFESGQMAKGTQLFEDLKQRSRHEYVPPMGFFYVHLARGEMDEASDCLEQACKQHDSFLPWCNVIPIDCYRIPDEPRFRRVLIDAGLE